MVNFTSFINYFWEAPTRPSEEVIYQLNQLEVRVDTNPIGGYRGKVGTLVINHNEHKVFTEWSKKDIKTLAKLTQTILKIREKAGVENTLILGRQNKEDDFKLSFVPYPKCNWIEKIQGLIHVIFGCPNLNQHQATEIAQFYKSEFSVEFKDEKEVMHKADKMDPFCRKEVLKKQKIVNLEYENEQPTDGTELYMDPSKYYLLHDNCPKGSSIEDPHLLVIPKGKSGHYYGSHVGFTQRFHMLQIIQKSWKIFLTEGYSSLLYEEREGSGIQGVQHKHSHAKGISHFPQTFFEKIKVFIGQLLPRSLSNEDLQKRITHYQEYDWKE